MISTTEIKVQGFHIDINQHVNNARYLEFLEMGRWHYIEEFLNQELLFEKNWIFVLVRLDIRYRNAAFFNEVLQVKTEIHSVDRVRIVMKQQIINKETQKKITDAMVTVVLLNQEAKKLLRLTPEVVALINLPTV